MLHLPRGERVHNDDGGYLVRCTWWRGMLLQTFLRPKGSKLSNREEIDDNGISNKGRNAIEEKEYPF